MKVYVRFGAAVLTAAALGFIPLEANASPITYDLVNLNVGAFAATGTITTDGATGTLVASDITGIDITVSQGSNSDTLTSLSDLIFVGSELSATPTALSFNFAGSGGEFGAETNTGFPYSGVCFLDGNEYCAGQTIGESVGYGVISIAQSGGSESGQLFQASGNVIATAAPTGVPEPATWAMLLAGIFGAGAMARFARRGVGKTASA